MKHGSLFSGIGGFDLAAEWMGWENIFHCEWNPFGQKVLSYYWPQAKSYHDITKTDFTIHRGQIDILTGGFPCQPYSLAGKRKGKEDDRHLWPEMLRAIREIQPRWVVGENVFGLVNWNDGLVFHEVQADLEAEGYEVFPYVLPAVSVNAPHRRDRVWFVAHRNSARFQTARAKFKTAGITGSSIQWDAADTQCIRLQKWCEDGNISSEERKAHGERGESTISIETISSGYHLNKWQSFPTQSPICNGNDGIPSKLDGITFSKWRQESIKAGGNAVVPQVVYQIFKTIEEYETIT